MRSAAALAWVGVLALLAVGCSSSVDTACDVEGISHEIEHMVGESSLQLTSLDALKCSGAWAVATATVSGGGQADETSTFLFEKTDAGWFLKSPEIACGGDPGMETVAEALRQDACSVQ
jgi:hypothetical protein